MPNFESRGHLGIPKGKMDQFLEACRAFKTIRDRRLFRGEFNSFDAYCRAKWGKSGEEVNRLIAEAEVELQARNANPGLQ
jgi:hypothetical protein